MIKPVTFQGVFNFKANLYALEVKSRFIDQSKANGYYKNYGNELAATVIGNTIQVGTGAFIVQGRMSEIVTAEVVSPTITNGYVGYVVARLETYHPSDEENTTIVTYIGTTLDAIPLTQDDIYQATADTTNKVYELPLYSFSIQNGTITNLVKLIQYCGDYERIKAIVDAAYSTAESALVIAQAAETKADNAVSIANTADTNASAAVTAANSASAKADGAIEIAQGAETVANTAAATVASEHTQMTAEIAELAEQIGEKQGTTVKINNVAQATFDADNLLSEDDTINISGGGS